MLAAAEVYLESSSFSLGDPAGAGWGLREVRICLHRARDGTTAVYVTHAMTSAYASYAAYAVYAADAAYQHT